MRHRTEIAPRAKYMTLLIEMIFLDIFLLRRPIDRLPSRARLVYCTASDIFRGSPEAAPTVRKSKLRSNPAPIHFPVAWDSQKPEPDVRVACKYQINRLVPV